MGYTAQIFAVNLDKVRALFGSKDEQILKQIMSTELYDHYSSEGLNVSGSRLRSEAFDDILREIIIKGVRKEDRKTANGFLRLFKTKPDSDMHAKNAHLYGYALLLICGTIGTQIEPNTDMFHSGAEWKEVNELFDEKGISINLDRMWNSEKLFDIPEIPDFPVISHYSKPEISYLLEELKKMDIDEDPIDEDYDPGTAEALLRSFRDGLRLCHEKQVEWVAFMH